MQIHKLIDGEAIYDVQVRTFSCPDINFRYYIFGISSANNHIFTSFWDAYEIPSNLKVVAYNDTMTTVNASSVIEVLAVRNVTKNSFQYNLERVSDYQKQYGSQFWAYGIK